MIRENIIYRINYFKTLFLSPFFNHVFEIEFFTIDVYLQKRKMQKFWKKKDLILFILLCNGLQDVNIYFYLIQNVYNSFSVREWMSWRFLEIELQLNPLNWSIACMLSILDLDYIWTFQRKIMRKNLIIQMYIHCIISPYYCFSVLVAIETYFPGSNIISQHKPCIWNIIVMFCIQYSDKCSSDTFKSVQKVWTRVIRIEYFNIIFRWNIPLWRDNIKISDEFGRKKCKLIFTEIVTETSTIKTRYVVIKNILQLNLSLK